MIEIHSSSSPHQYHQHCIASGWMSTIVASLAPPAQPAAARPSTSGARNADGKPVIVRPGNARSARVPGPVVGCWRLAVYLPLDRSVPLDGGTGPVAQLGEHRVRIAGVAGSSPARSTIPIPPRTRRLRVRIGAGCVPAR